MLLTLTALLALLYKSGKRKSSKLLGHFKASYSFLGTMTFRYSETTFFLSRLSSGRGINGSGGGSYPVLMTRVGTPHRFVAGNAKAQKYYMGSFRGMKIHSLNNSPELFVASSDENLSARAMAIIPQIENINKLFEKNFGHLKIDHVRYIEKFFMIKKRTVLTYVGLSEEVYQDPKKLEEYLDTILELSRNLGLGLSDSD